MTALGRLRTSDLGIEVNSISLPEIKEIRSEWVPIKVYFVKKASHIKNPKVMQKNIQQKLYNTKEQN